MYKFQRKWNLYIDHLLKLQFTSELILENGPFQQISHPNFYIVQPEKESEYYQTQPITRPWY
jgi:hypothetical protein